MARARGTAWMACCPVAPSSARRRSSAAPTGPAGRSGSHRKASWPRRSADSSSWARMMAAGRRSPSSTPSPDVPGRRRPRRTSSAGPSSHLTAGAGSSIACAERTGQTWASGGAMPRTIPVVGSCRRWPRTSGSGSPGPPDLAGTSTDAGSSSRHAARSPAGPGILDPETGGVQAVSDPELGASVGLVGDALVVRGACRGLPCPVVAVDVDDGSRRSLSDGAGLATVVAAGQGDAFVVVETDPTGGRLRALDVDDGTPVDLGALDSAARLVTASSGSGAALPIGAVLVAPDGRVPRAGSTGGEVRRVSHPSDVSVRRTDPPGSRP